MLQFVLILAITFTGTTLDESNATTTPSIEFSKPAAEFESGQPVFPIGTKAYIKDLPSDNSRVLINDKVDKVLTTDKVDVSNLVDLSEGTYTVMIESSNGSKEIFGFTIK